MKEKKIKFLLVQIDEAHSTKWPIGLVNTPEPQKDFAERCERAKKFVSSNPIKEPFSVMIDGFDNSFGNKFRAWPDKYYLINNSYKVIAKSEYGATHDALINVDCVEHILNILNK